MTFPTKHWSKIQFGTEHTSNVVPSERTEQARIAAMPPERSTSPPMRRNLTTQEAADYLRLSPRSLERYRVEGTGPQYLKAGPGKRARVFYRIDDLDAWLEGTLFTSTSEYDER